MRDNTKLSAQACLKTLFFRHFHLTIFHRLSKEDTAELSPYLAVMSLYCGLPNIHTCLSGKLSDFACDMNTHRLICQNAITSPSRTLIRMLKVANAVLFFSNIPSALLSYLAHFNGC